MHLKNDDVEVEEDDDRPMLSSQALAALQEFLSEQNQTSETAQNKTESDSDEVALVSEDWRLSQFWYDAVTAETVAQEAVSLCSDSDSRVACIACPTLYAYLKKIRPEVSAKILEYDMRFEQYGSDFAFYDYNQPQDLPLELKHAFNVVVADPPYLMHVAGNMIPSSMSSCEHIVWSSLESHAYKCEVQKERAAELLGLRPCGFRPQHSSKLGNEFRLFTNYGPGTRLGGWEQEN
ncbi:protein-lysine N-methyltransferase [Citrus sinensis]|uniref:Protein-lysine N-methyltransferase n=1 Tax=Citrus sinensis TaxID=2711 RepID=A0ACB8JYP3_CITSI|nr:protein-lysine N-methyltransferase [Citrus sinensis]